MGNLSGSGKISISGRATISAEQVRTGRYIVANELHAHVQEWAMSADQERHELYREFLHSLPAARTLSEGVVCFRGRRIAATKKPTSEDMGPPLSKRVAGQRYNRAGNPALYLCENVRAVPRELVGASDPLWIQRFVLPTDVLAVADFRVGEAAELITQTFWFAEHAGEAPVMPPFSFSQCVADLVASRFDAMLVPGVRGDRDFRYNNVVVITRVDEWRAWIDGTWEPRLVDEVAT